MVHYVVVGGGVAGVCTAEELCRLCPADCISLVSADRVLKVRSSWQSVGLVLWILLAWCPQLSAAGWVATPSATLTGLPASTRWGAGRQHRGPHHPHP